jgi:antitoxin MazE
MALAAIAQLIVQSEDRRGMLTASGYAILCVYPSEEISSCRFRKAVRLPATVVKALDLKPSDNIEIRVVGSRDLEVSRDESRQRALENLRKLSRPLPPGLVFDREEA